MCQLKALAIIKEQCITGFKAILRLCQVAAGKQVTADLASSREWRGVAMANDAQHPHTVLASTCVRLTAATTFVQIDAFFQVNLYFS